MDIIKKVKELNLPEGSYIVEGSGVMAGLRIREARDIDLVVSPEVYVRLKEDGGWEEKTLGDINFLAKDIYEIWLTWNSKDNEPNLKELLKGAHIIDGVTFVNIKRLLEWKERRRLEKDINDIELIKKYLAND